MVKENTSSLTELDLSNSSTLTIEQAINLAKALEKNTVTGVVLAFIVDDLDRPLVPVPVVRLDQTFARLCLSPKHST